MGKDDALQENKKSIVREYAEAIVIAFILAMIIRTFVVQAFKIPSGSMIPTLQIGDHILVSKFIYWFTKPKRGDLIVFKYPKDPSRDFIKRVVGLPGETLEVKHRKVYINGKLLKEDYPIFSDKRRGQYGEIPVRDNFSLITIPPNRYFMMGDNRDNSLDSRFWGTLDEGMIEGRAFIVYWSIAPSLPLPPLSSFGDEVNDFFSSLGTIFERVRWVRIGRVLH